MFFSELKMDERKTPCSRDNFLDYLSEKINEKNEYYISRNSLMTREFTTDIHKTTLNFKKLYDVCTYPKGLNINKRYLSSSFETESIKIHTTNVRYPYSLNDISK